MPLTAWRVSFDSLIAACLVVAATNICFPGRKNDVDVGCPDTSELFPFPLFRRRRATKLPRIAGGDLQVSHMQRRTQAYWAMG